MANLIGMYSIKVVEHVAFMYLRALSFNQVIAILGSQFEKKVFTKDRLIHHIETLSDRIPDMKSITLWLKPIRFGYYAIDGTWLKYRGKNFVLLILLDVHTLDIIGYITAPEENEASYQILMHSCYAEIKGDLKGFFCDGDPGLLKVLKKEFPNTPIQLCVFHKYARIQQIIPFIRIKNQIDKEIKGKVIKILFAKTEKECVRNFKELRNYAQEHKGYRKLQEIIGVLKRNFDLLLTHFENPQMSPYNNVLEGFNASIKKKTILMKGFKKPVNISRWLKLIILDWRFHVIKETKFQWRRGKSPLELAGVKLPKIWNWMTFVRKYFSL